MLAKDSEPILEASLGLEFSHFVQKPWDIFCLLMPIPSASSKIFWLCSNIFDHAQIYMQIYNVPSFFYHAVFKKILKMVKKIWTQLKRFWTSRWNRHKLHCTGLIQAHKTFVQILLFTNSNYKITILRYWIIIFQLLWVKKGFIIFRQHFKIPFIVSRKKWKTGPRPVWP